MDYSLCPYKYFFGKPNEGVHNYRILDIAIVDLGLTLLVAYLLSLYLMIDYRILFLILFLLGIIFHRLFCVRTTIDKLLFR
jgi:hypothetical protein